MKEFILNGTRITSLKRFYNEVEKELIVDTNAITNWSLDVLDDIFYGGYGLYDLEEEIVVKWTSFRRSQEKVNSETLTSIVDIFRSHENVILILE